MLGVMVTYNINETKHNQTQLRHMKTYQLHHQVCQSAYNWNMLPFTLQSTQALTCRNCIYEALQEDCFIDLGLVFTFTRPLAFLFTLFNKEKLLPSNPHSLNPSEKCLVVLLTHFKSANLMTIPWSLTQTNITVDSPGIESAISFQSA